MQELLHTYAPAAEVDEKVRTQIEIADRGFCAAVAIGDIEGAAREIYTEDALILPPGAPMVRGRDSIVAFWREAAREMELREVQLSTIELRQAGDFVHQVGRAVIDAGGATLRGKYTLLWRQENGRWKWHIDCWNLDS